MFRFHWDSSHTGLLPQNSLRNGIRPEAVFLLKQDSSQNGIPPEMGFLPKRDFSRQEFHGRSPGREDFLGRSSYGGVPREEFLGGVYWEKSRLGGVLEQIWKSKFVKYTNRIGITLQATSMVGTDMESLGKTLIENHGKIMSITSSKLLIWG